MAVGWFAVAAAIGNTYAEKRKYEKEKKEIERLNKIAEAKAQADANRKFMQYFATDTALTTQQAEMNQAMSEEASQIASDIASKQAQVNVSLGESGISGNLKKRLDTILENRLNKEQGNIEYNRRSAIRQLQGQKQSAYYNADPSTVYLTPTPQWDSISQGLGLTIGVAKGVSETDWYKNLGEKKGGETE